jgi:RND superfamily putative drug exporter
MFEALGDLVYRRRWLTLALASGFLAASVAMVVHGGHLTSGTIEGLEAERAQHLVEEVIGRPLDTTFAVIFQASDVGPALEPDDQEFVNAMADALAPLRADSAIASVTSPDDAPPELALGMANGKGALAYVTVKGDFRGALASYPRLRALLKSRRLTITCTGKLPYMSDLNRTLEHDLLKAEIISLPLAILVLLLVFRTLVAAVLPVAVGALAVLGGMAVVLGLSGTLDIAQYTINVCSLIGLGVAIDYSLFTVSRYREELAQGADTRTALRRAMATSGRMVCFSGVAVGTGLAGLLFFKGSYLWAMGLGGAIVVALAVLFALTFLPALLAVLGPRINALRIPAPRLGSRLGRKNRFWHAMALGVMHRPLAVLLPTLAVLMCMGVPFLHLRLAAADARVLDGSVEARRGYDRLVELFPDLGGNRVFVTVQFPEGTPLTEARIGALWDLSQRMSRIPHVAKTESLFGQLPVKTRDEAVKLLLHPPAEAKGSLEEAIRLATHGSVALLSLTTDGPPESLEARAVVRAVRAVRQVADGQLWVGGQTANDLDSTEFILSRTPAAVGFVMGATFLILFLMLGSVLLPLKAVLMNLVSICGSFGALVWIFQDGHLFIREPRPLEPSLPVLLFCVIFGLSMDYEVLMLTRIKEAYDRTHDNTASVAEGLEKTAGLITSAAAIMVAVFSAFSIASVVLIEAVGVGMALAVALDATLVRVLMVPATMRLFGDLNWWGPKWVKGISKRLEG